MPEALLRRSALAHLEPTETTARAPAHGIALREKPLPALLNLRLDPRETGATERVQTALGLALPEMGRSSSEGGHVAYRLGPDEFWIAAEGTSAEVESRLRSALEGLHAAVTEIGEGWAQIEVSGRQARALMAKGCPLDFHPRVFLAGEVKQSLIAKADCVYRLVADEDSGGPVFELTVRRSFADYVWRWLHDAAGEYGVSVVGASPRSPSS